MDNLAEFQSLRATMERCSEIVSDSYCLKPEEMLQFEGELPPNHSAGARRQRYWVTEVNGDLVVALPGTTHPLDWSSNMRVHYTPIDGSHPPADTPPELLEQQPCAHAGFYFRAETIPTLALLEQAAAKGMRLVLTGHSLGAAVANMCTLTVLSAQKKAREAAANAAVARHTVRASEATIPAPQQQQQQQQQQQHKKKQKQKQRLISPWQAAASAAAVASAEAHSNHSWCSANSDILVSPQAALVDVLCVAFASPHWANQALADYIEDNDWGDTFVNVVVPEDYCLKLFNNVLTSANPAERHTLSRSSSRCSLNESSSATRLADEAAEDAPCCTNPLEAPLSTAAAAAAAAAGCLPVDPVGGPTAADKQALLYGMHSDSSSSSSSITSSSLPTRHSYQPGVQQPLVSALAGTRRKQKKQLSFALPDQTPPSSTADTSAPAAEAVAGSDTPSVPPAAGAACSNSTRSTTSSSRVPLDAARPPGLTVPGMYAAAGVAEGGSWAEVHSSPPSSPSCASLSSLSSLNSTRSWTLMAYLPDVLMRTFSSGSGHGSSGSLDDSSNSSSRASSDGGCPDAAADAIAAMFAPCVPVMERVGVSASSSADSPSSSSSSSSSNGSGWGLRHARSAVDLSLSSLSGSDSDSDCNSSSSYCSVDDTVLPELTSRSHETPAAAAAPGMGLDLSLSLQQKHNHHHRPQHQVQVQSQGVVCSASKAPLRRSATSASLSALSRPAGSLKLTSSLASVGALLPSLRSVLRASRAALNKASSITEAVLDVPLSVFELGLIKALKPPMYKPVGQQWILSATGLVPQQQPIFMYPKHVHDVYWHKELALVAFREHSILFYKKRLLQQANRR